MSDTSSDIGGEPRRDLVRRSVGVERTGSLVGRGLELAAALSKRAHVQVVATGYASFVLFGDGSLWSWGLNESERDTDLCVEQGVGRSSRLGFKRNSVRHSCSH